MSEADQKLRAKEEKEREEDHQHQQEEREEEIKQASHFQKVQQAFTHLDEGGLGDVARRVAQTRVVSAGISLLPEKLQRFGEQDDKQRRKEKKKQHQEVANRDEELLANEQRRMALGLDSS